MSYTPPVGDASTTKKGVLQLAGDLGGTATSPTVPGLSGKANTSHNHQIEDVVGLDTALASSSMNVRFYSSGTWQARGTSPFPVTFDAGLTDPVPQPTDWLPGDHIISLNPPTAP